MTALSIDNLAIDTALDSAALKAIVGGGRVAWEFLGSSAIRQTGFRYTGRYSRRFIGNSYLSGHGYVAKYRTAYEYKNVQTKWNHYNEFWK